jgi:hypothetical protein
MKVQTNESDIDNAQYTPKIVPLIIKAMKLYSCWSGIMRKTFCFGEASASSVRIESNFNQLKNRVFKSDNLPLRIDTFLERFVSYYKGDHLLIQNNIPLEKIYDTNTITSNQSSDSDRKNLKENADYEKVDKIHIDIVTLDKNSNTCIERNTKTNAEEQWQKKGKSTTFKNNLSKISYFNLQARFEDFDVNKKVSEKQIVFFKNRNKFNNSKNHNENADAEYEKNDKIHIDTVTLDKNSNTYICNYTVIY